MYRRNLAQVFLSACIAATTLACDEDAAEPFGLAPLAEKVIGVEGGSLETETFRLEIPPGALDGDETIRIYEASAPQGFQSQSEVFELAPDGLVFAKPIVVRLDFTGSPTGLVVFHSKLGAPGFDELSGTIDGQTIAVEIDHFSTIFAGKVDDRPGTGGTGGGDGQGGEGGEDGQGGAGGEGGQGGAGGGEGGAGGDGEEEEDEEVDLDLLNPAERKLAEALATFEHAEAIHTLYADVSNLKYTTTLFLTPFGGACGESEWPGDQGYVRCNFFPTNPTSELAPDTYAPTYPNPPQGRWVLCQYMARPCAQEGETVLVLDGTIRLDEASPDVLEGRVDLEFRRMGDRTLIGRYRADFGTSLCKVKESEPVCEE